MTNKEAACLIKVAQAEIEWEYPLDYSVAFDMAIKALEQEPCEDAISRQAAIDAVKARITYAKAIDKNGNAYNMFESENAELEKAIRNIEILPSVVRENQTGHWIDAKVGKFFPSNDFKCSECGNILDFGGVNCGRGDANYCPNCGAKMGGEQE